MIRDHLAIRYRFGYEYGIPRHVVRELIHMANNAAYANERSCNGDRHPGEPGADKNRNSELWGISCDVWTSGILRTMQPYGFTDVVFTGLRPTLKRNEQFVEIPN